MEKYNVGDGKQSKKSYRLHVYRQNKLLGIHAPSCKEIAGLHAHLILQTSEGYQNVYISFTY